MSTKERPILFSGPMVRALLEGRKTQTRRVVKPQPVDADAADHGDVTWDGPLLVRMRDDGAGLDLHDFPCPYGVPGDRLFVRESIRVVTDWIDTSHGPSRAESVTIEYAADGDNADSVTVEIPEEIQEAVASWSIDKVDKCPHHRINSIHMPRWASRITLEVVSVRVERVEDITEVDAIVEGFVSRKAFLHTFYDLNERAPRGSNPWVWVVEFKRIGART